MFEAKLPGNPPHRGEPVAVKASIARIQTMADNGLRVALDLSENEIITAMSLLYLKQQKVIVEVTVKPYKP